MANTGYKFLTKSGIYFRTGIYLGAYYGIIGDDLAFVDRIMPMAMLDLSIGFKF